MIRIDLFLDGDKYTEIECKPENLLAVTILLSKLGIYASCHKYNFQFEVKQ